MNDETIRKVMQELGRRGGKSTSPAKAAAARENAKKGGRPKSLEKASDGRRRRRNKSILERGG